ncbi:SDR family NAD(P)-dependent oxidoreductase [Spongisporangium articulatum]|uniref:SDR family NAD(P)-dependent oxidoreductase n=1 Tax=Spongisporangium articulatum TaxID=3362603 RepID=A0ABW8AML4_9ACTN
MSATLAGKVALVTGGNRGLGAACVRELAARGATVAVLARDPEAAAVVVKELPGEGHLALPGDVTRQETLDAAVATVLAERGQLNVVVANAGVNRHGSLGEVTGDEYAEVVNTNLIGTYRTARATADALAAGRGYLMIVSSVAAFAAVGGMAPYASSKAGLEMLAHTLWLDLAPRGVDVGTVVPTWITTDMLAEAEAGIDDFAELRNTTEGLLSMYTDGVPGGPLGGSVSAEECATRIVDGIEARERRIWIPPILEEIWRLGPLLNSPLGEILTRKLLES